MVFNPHGDDCDVIIAGAGITGWVLAGLLQKQGLAVLLLETSKPKQNIKQNIVGRQKHPHDPRSLAITRASEKLLNHIGVWPHIPEAERAPFKTMHIWDESGHGSVFFDSAHICESSMGSIIPSSILLETLRQVLLNQQQLNYLDSVEIESIQVTQQQSVITLKDNRKISAPLLVAADGAQSRVRELQGIGMRIQDCEQTAIAAIVETERDHDHCARQRFLTQGPLALLPLAQANRCGIVWSTAPGMARHLLAMDKQQFNQVLAQNCEYVLGQVVHSEARVSYPLRQTQVTEYCRPRLALIGDAAHTIHPMAGQGANLGIMDAAVLADVIAKAQARQSDIGAVSVLRRYERWRKGENALMIQVLSGLKQIFQHNSNLLVRLRGMGMNRFNKIELVKEWIMRRSMGLTGDLPDSLKQR